jgi:Rad3-related DNA helicase
VNDLITAFDGTNRQPRPVQIQALNWYNASQHKIKVMQLPTGSGKSAIARAIQLKTNAAIVVPSNPLLDQYIDTYKGVNYLKGAGHYQCGNSGLTCEDKRTLQETPCNDCPYRSARTKAVQGEPTIFNPISMYYAAEHKKWTGFKTIIVDEAHKLVDTLHLLSSIEFRKGRYGFKDVTDARTAKIWIKGLIPQLSTLAKKYKDSGDYKQYLDLNRQMSRMESVLHGLENYPDQYVVYSEERPYRDTRDTFLIVKPLNLPGHILKQVLGDFDELVLMSATLPKLWVKEIVGKMPFDYLDVPSSIPVESRLIYVDQVGLTGRSEPQVVAEWIKKHWKGENCIVHVSYYMARQLKQYFPDALIHDAKTKTTVLEQFKTHGGLWLAGGCAEGIDLAGDVARLNLIPNVQMANIGDPYVKAKMTQNRNWYEVNALVTTIQQAGRTTRGAEDSSKTVIGDERIIRIVGKHSSEVPRSFREALRIWEG